MCTQIKLLETSLGETLFRTSGRSLVLTEFGKLVYSHTEEIFTLGGEILRATKEAPSSRRLHLHVGIVDSFPKLMSYDILRPVLEHEPPVQLTRIEKHAPSIDQHLSAEPFVYEDLRPEHPGESGASG